MRIRSNPIGIVGCRSVSIRYDARDGDERSGTDPRMDDEDDDDADETRDAPPVWSGEGCRTDELAKWTGAVRVSGED